MSQDEDFERQFAELEAEAMAEEQGFSLAPNSSELRAETDVAQALAKVGSLCNDLNVDAAATFDTKNSQNPTDAEALPVNPAKQNSQPLSQHEPSSANHSAAAQLQPHVQVQAPPTKTPGSRVPLLKKRSAFVVKKTTANTPSGDEPSQNKSASIGATPIAAIDVATPSQTQAASAIQPVKPTLGTKVSLNPGAKAAKAAHKPEAKPSSGGVPADGCPAATAAASIKKNQSAFMFFAAANRDAIKKDNLGISFGDLSKKVSEVWKGMSDDDKAVYNQRAAADKERYQREIEEIGGASVLKEANLAAKGSKPARTKSAYELFCAEHRPMLKKDNPKASMPEITKLLATAWKDLPQDEKSTYEAQSKALKAAAKADVATCSNKPKKRAGTAKEADASGAKRGKRAAAPKSFDQGEEDAEMEDAGAEPTPKKHPGQCDASPEGDSDDEDTFDRVAVDWEAHPAVAILGKYRKSSTRERFYVVQREGLPVHKSGLILVTAAHAALRGGDAHGASAQACPLNAGHLQDWETFQRTFKHDTFNQLSDGELDLDPEMLKDDSLLEFCAFLGFLREGGDLDTKEMDKKNDTWMKVPVMGTSRVVQRAVHVERQRTQAMVSMLQEKRGENEMLQVELQELKKRVDQLEALCAKRGIDVNEA